MATTSFPFPVPTATACPVAPFVFPIVSAEQEEDDEDRTMFRVPTWMPVPVEGALYFVIGALLGGLLMTLLASFVTAIDAPSPSSEPAASAPRQPEAGVRRLEIVVPRTGVARAPEPVPEPVVVASVPAARVARFVAPRRR